MWGKKGKNNNHHERCNLFAELDGFPAYAGYAADMPMDGMDGVMMQENYPSSMTFDRQAY